MAASQIKFLEFSRFSPNGITKNLVKPIEVAKSVPFLLLEAKGEFYAVFVGGLLQGNPIASKRRYRRLVMECNRDEALRAIEIAEKKFTAQDIAGAKKFALKAQNLFPSLEGINQLLATLDVYLAAEMKVNGESDWYAILCLNASSDEESIKKQYRKLALQLHPDKNKSIGAEGAFQLLSKAWSVLSDKSKKMIYDQMRKVCQSKSNKNGFYNFANDLTSNKRPRKNTTCSTQSNTFWTSCNRCRMQYEYLRVYLNHNLLCPNCHEAFLAVETGFPSHGASSNFSLIAPQQHQKKSNLWHSENLDSCNNSNVQWSTFSKTAVQAANMVKQTYEKVKQERKEAQAAARREEALWKTNSSSKRTITSYYNASGSGNVAMVDGPTKKGRSDMNSDSGETTHVDNETERPGAGLGDPVKMRISTRINKFTRDMLQIDKRGLLMEKAKRELSKKLVEWNVSAAARLTDKAKAKQKHKQGNNSKVKTMSTLQNNCNKYAQCMKEPIKHASIVVPDPEFHDFDKDRLERSFEGDQVWATYDNDDGMPRFYALIQKVISLRPFKLRMSFLTSKSNRELGPMNWVVSGFAKTCGDFRVSRYHVNDTINIFSHKVKFEKGARGIIRIFPMKGETWALYKNWSHDWNMLTPENVIHKYDIVEVVEDYNEDQDVVVTPLVKVAGFRAVFHRHLDPKEVKRIPREEMFRFSHQVPSNLLTGEEAHNAPKGCRELDPAAIPSDLLQLITEFKEDEVLQTSKIQI